MAATRKARSAARKKKPRKKKATPRKTAAKRSAKAQPAAPAEFDPLRAIARSYAMRRLR